MLTRKTPPTLATDLTIEGQGEKITFGIVYNNVTSAELDVWNKQPSAVLTPEKEGDPVPSRSLGESILYIVHDWQSEYPLTIEGVQEMEAARPGICMCILQGWYKARGVHIAGN